jgi:hypothetical protein
MTTKQLRNSALFGCMLALGLVTACSSVKTRVDKEPIKARTFSFLNTGSRPAPGYADTRTQAHEVLQQAITRWFAGKGVSSVASGGDITVAYLVVVGNNSTTTSLNSYFGYTDDAQKFVEKVHSEQTGGQQRGYFEAGTLVIDVLQTSTGKLLQRRTMQAQVLRNLPLDSRKTRVQEIVDQTLRDLPVQGAS